MVFGEFFLSNSRFCVALAHFIVQGSGCGMLGRTFFNKKRHA